MSLQFYNSGNYGYLRGNPPVTARAFSIHAWVKANDNAAAMHVGHVGVWEQADSDLYYGLVVAGDLDICAVQGRNSALGGYEGTFTPVDSFDPYFGVWTPVTGHFPSAAGWYCSIAGGTNAAPTVATYECLSSPNAFLIGGSLFAPHGNFDGRISMLSVWNINLSDAQEAELNTLLPSAVSFYSSNCVAFYDFRVNDANILTNKKNPGTYDLTAYGTTQPQYYADDPTFSSDNSLKLLLHPSAVGLSGISGVVYQAPTGNNMSGDRVGEFTGASFELVTEGGGDDERAVLLVPTSNFNGGSLPVGTNVVVEVKSATHTSRLTPAVIITG